MLVCCAIKGLTLVKVHHALMEQYAVLSCRDIAVTVTVFTGLTCTNNSACQNNPCFNQGLCQTQNTSPFFQCICPSGYTGIR